jgi:N-acetylmuramic acid 6-phosphate etherase
MMLTESRNPRTSQIDQLSALEIVQVMNEEDATVASAVKVVLPQVAQAVEAISGRIASGGRLFYVGAGTSGRLGVIDAVECVPTFSTPPELVQAIMAGGSRAFTEPIEGAEDSREQGRNDLLARGITAADAVVGIAASGRTPYVVSALETANAIGAVTVAVVCNSPSPMLDVAKIGIAALVGPEVISGSTRLKSGTAQKMILNMLSTASMIRLGKVYGNLMVDVRLSNEKLFRRGRGIIMEVAGVDEAEAERLLAESNNEVKTAIAMSLLGVGADEARSRLGAAGGRLAAALAASSE